MPPQGGEHDIVLVQRDKANTASFRAQRYGRGLLMVGQPAHLLFSTLNFHHYPYYSLFSLCQHLSTRLGGRGGHKAPPEDAWIMSAPNKLNQICNYVILSLIENLVH